MKTATGKKPVKYVKSRISKDYPPKRAVKKQTPKAEAKTLSPLAEAIRAKSPIEIIEKLIFYEENLKRETARLAYIEAFQEMQNVLPDLPKVKEAVDKNGKVYHYCPLPIMKEKLQPYLYKFGFSYRWDFKPVGKDQIECIFIVTHSKGHQELASMVADLDDSESMNNLQSVGSTRTYLQRYSMIAGLGLSTAEEDNDGGTSATKTTSTISGPKAISDERVTLEEMELEELMLKIPRKPVDDFIKEKFGEKTYFSEKEKAEIKKFIVDTILEK